MSFGEGNLHIQVAQLKTENARLKQQLDAMPGIVRCRDCKDYRKSDSTCHAWQWHNWDAAIEVEPDDFCSYGQRKEGSDD